MTTIPDTMKLIVNDIQYVYEELIKLLIRKSLRPVLNPLGANSKIVYNNYRNRYERGYIGSLSEDSVNKYNYVITNESLGWTDEILTNFKVSAKFIKNSATFRFPVGNSKCYNSTKPKAQVAFSDREGKQQIYNSRVPSVTQYKNFVSMLSTRNMANMIANKKASFTYTTDVPYSHSFKELEDIGQDIIDQTDPSICGSDSAKMSTSMLRVKLHNLEIALSDLSVQYPEIYDAYLSMVCIINSLPKNKIVWITNFIASMTYQSWDDLEQHQKQLFVDSLGENFIYEFNNNKLITILLQSDSSHIILTGSYLYSLLKMLFIIFGFSRITPLVTDKCSETHCQMMKERMKKHTDKYRGAYFRRGDPREMIIYHRDRDHYNHNHNHNHNHNGDYSDSDSDDDNNNYYNNYYPNNNVPYNMPNQYNQHNQHNMSNQYDPSDEWSDNYTDDQGNPTRVLNKNIVLNNNNRSNLLTNNNVKSVPYYIDPEPIDQRIYDYIKLFDDLYPSILGIMGGVDNFLPEAIEIKSNSVPSTYNDLSTVPAYLWRYNDYSYCRYLDHISSKQLATVLSSKINSKARYLQTI